MTIKLGSAVALLAVAVLVAPPAAAQTLSGRLTAAFDTWELRDTDSTSTDVLRAYQLAVLDLKGLGHRNLSFHASLRGQGDLGNELVDGESFKVRNLYGAWKVGARGLELRAGRMQLHAGVANLNVDGGWGRIAIRDRWRAEAFAGVQSPVDLGGNIPTWEHNRAFGGRLITDQLAGALSAAFSAMRRDRKLVRYGQDGRYTGRVVTMPDRQEEVYGLDVAYRPGYGTSVYHQLEYDRLRAEVRKLMFSGRVAPPGAAWSLDADYVRREPSLDRNSILAVFDHGDYNEISVRGRYDLPRAVRLFGGFTHTVVEDDDAQRLTAGLQHGALSLSYGFRTGYSGRSDALTGSYVYSLGRALGRPRALDLRLGGGLTSYRLDDTQDERDLSWTVTAGARGMVRRNLSVDLEVQNLTQDLNSRPGFAGATHDVRSYLKLSYWFSTGRDSRSVF